MHRSIKKLLCLAMVSVMVLGAFPIMASAAPARDTAFMAGNQIVVQICETEFHHYFPAWWGERVSRQLIRNPDGSILELNVEQSSFTAQLQDAEGEIVFARNISFELPLFGALFSGENYNFAAFGQSNWDERTDVEVIRIVRYDKQWNRIDDLRLFGGVYGDFGHHGYRNVANPFGGGASRFAEYGDTLVLHMGRHMYHCMCDIRGGARHNHQSALYVFVDIPTMTFVPTGGLPWVSHSFNQFPIFANGQPVFLDKGTGFPRTLAVHRGREYTQRFYYIFQHDGTRRDMDARDWAAVGYVYRYYYFIRPNGSFQPLTRTDWGEYFYHSQDGLWTAHFVPAQYVNLAERNVHIDTGIHRFFDYGILYETPGSTGDNFMGVSIGGFGASSQNFIASVNIAPAFNYVANRQRNIYTLTLPLDFVVDEIGQRNRIATMEGTNRIASVPVMSQVGFDSFALMWREFEMLAPITQSVTPYNTVPLEFVVQYVDGRGLPVGQPLRFDTKDAMLAEVLMIGYEGSIFPPVETAPAITSVANTSVQYDSGGTFQVVAIGTAPIVFSLADAPAGVSINSTSGLITVAPNSLEIGVHTFRVVASGTVAPDAEQIFTLTVTDAPALHSVTILGGGAGASATPNPASVGERVNLHAGQAPSGQVFQNWTVSPSAIALTNATSPTAANFEMIDAPVEVTANWQNATITQPPAQPSARPPASGGGGWVGNIIIRPGGTPPVQPAPPTPVTPEVLPDIVTAVVYPANVTHVHTVVQNQISAGVNNVVLALPTGYSAVSVTASTLQAIAA
ncbi:MAG: hypothetical protein FWC89_14435, partial [Defluviitaleaceae bacterium]|nr:hypothetical protein [Defluviitaleaceae bacterium]